MQYAAFKDSAVTGIDTHQLREEATLLPVTLFPVYVGNGNIGVNLDASGLQSLDTRRAGAWWGGNAADGNYVFRHGFLSSHLAWQRYDFPFNLMPLGYLDWTLRYRDVEVTSANLSDHAHVWIRSVDLQGSTVETSMLLDIAVRLTVAVFIPFGGTKIVLRFDLKAYDERNQPIDPPTPFTLTARMNLGLRDGSSIFDTVEYDTDSVRLEHDGYERYAIRYRWQADKPVVFRHAADAYGIEWSGSTGDEMASLRCCIDIDAPEHAEPLSFDTLAVGHRADWDAFWDKSGSVTTGDSRKDFLYANSVHFLRCAHEYAKGGLGGSLSTHPECWMGCNFWDMMWLGDGLLRSNNADLVVDFIRWLRTVMRPKGRPFPWMMTYNGVTPVKPEEDQGVVVIDAFATIAIKAYLETRDEAFFLEFVWPICDRVCSFLVSDMFTREGDHYILGTPVAHDVGGMGKALINETYTSVWSVSVLRRTLMLAREHGLHPEWANIGARIVEHARFESDDTYYSHARGMAIKDFSFCSWVGNLLYPTEMGDVLDMEKVNATTDAFAFVPLYMEKQGDYQPWSYFWSALNDFRRGEVDSAERTIQDGMQFTHGGGYFCECGPAQWGACGLPPYPAPHGAFLTCVSEQFFAGSYWDDTLYLCTNFPSGWRDKLLTCRNIRSGNGCLLESLTYSPERIDAVISGRGRHRIVCRVPSGISNPARLLTVDDMALDAVYDETTRILVFSLDLNNKPCTITIGKSI